MDAEKIARDIIGDYPRQYRKKPVVIEAYRTRVALDIETLEGTMHAEPGDYIITGIKGETYPCKPDIFMASYELVEQSQGMTDRLMDGTQAR